MSNNCFPLPAARMLAILLLTSPSLAVLAATPSSGTLTDTSGSLSYTFPAAPTPNTSQSTIYTCNTGPADPCDVYTLTVKLPAGFTAQHPGLTLKISAATTSSGSDIDLQLADANGNNLAQTRDNPPAQPTILYPAADGDHTYQVQVVPGTPNEGGNVSVSLVAGVIAAPLAAVDPSNKVGYENFEAPGVFTTTAQSNGNTIEWLGRGAGEPSIGVNWQSKAPNDKAGVTNFQSDLQTLFVTFDDLCPAGGKKATWNNLHAPTQAGVDSDPIGFTNTGTGRIFAGELTLLSPTCKISYTDNDGATWVPTAGPNGAAIDHQTIAGGPYHTINGVQPPNTVAGGAFYYCSQDLAAAYCMRSDDGGNTWTGEIPWSTGCSSQLHGHVKVAPDGSVYIPDKNCSSNTAGMAVSTDNGATWSVSLVRNTTLGYSIGTSGSDPAIGIDKGGRVYFANATGDSALIVATTADQGTTWTNFSNITSALGIKGVRFPAAVGGDAGRAAVAFYGTNTAGDFNNGETFRGTWDLYIAHTFDGGASWTVTDATPNLPMQRGCLWSGGGGEICRNLLDFFDIAIDKQGRVQVGYVNGCPGGACALAAPGSRGNDYSATATIARQSSGRRLIAANDPSSSTSAPGMPSVTVYRVGTIAHLAWSLADTGNSSVTSFNILRGTTATSLTVIATVAGDQSRYDDTTATNPTKTYYYAVQAVNSVGSSCSNNVVAAPYMGDTCPGLAIHQNDPTHQESAQVQNGANANLAIDWFSVAEPITDLKNGATLVAAAGTYLKFTMKVSNLATVPPDSRWRMVWNSYDSPGRLFFVGMRDTAGAQTFNYGVVGDAGLPAVLVLSEQNPKVALAGSNFNADGTITVYVPKSGVGNPSPGDLLGALGGKTFTGDSGAAGNYQRSTALVDHTFVKGVTDNSFPATAYLLRDAAHLTNNHVPVATVSVDKNYGNPGTTVAFTGTQADPLDGDVSGAYVYDFGDGTAVQTKTCAQFPNPSFACASTTHKYDNPGYYTATLVAKDSCEKASDPVTVLIHINAPPTVNAGADFTVDEGQGAMLSATANDPDGDALTYSWKQTAGPPATLTGADTATPTFTAPSIGTDTPLTFEVTVSDPLLLAAKDSVTVTVHNLTPNIPPVANAGADVTVNEKLRVTLNGAASSDPDGDLLTYSWAQTAGPDVTLTGANTATPTFTAPDVSADTPLTFVLTVADTSAATATDSVIVTVKDVPVPVDPSYIGNDKVGALPAGSLLLLGLAGLARRRRR